MSGSVLLLWVIVGSSGAISSGSAEFVDEQACKLGQTALIYASAEAANHKNLPQPWVGAKCVPKQVAP